VFVDAALAPNAASLLGHGRALDHLDARAPWICDVSDRGAGRCVLPRRLVQLDAFRLDLLCEGSVVLHIEAKMVEHTALGGRLRRVDLGKPDLDAWNVHDRLVIAHARLAAEGLRVPGLCLRDLGFRQEQMHVLVADRHRLALVFQDLHAQAVRRLDIGLIEPAVAAGQHRDAVEPSTWPPAPARY
jgi:hypothetical protein